MQTPVVAAVAAVASGSKESQVRRAHLSLATECYYLLAHVAMLRRMSTEAVLTLLRGIGFALRTSAENCAGLSQANGGVKYIAGSTTTLRQTFRLRLLLCRCYIDQNRTTEAKALLEQLESHVQTVVDTISLNMVCVE